LSSGVLLAQHRGTLAIRLPITPAIVILAASLSAATPCAGQDSNALATAGTAAIEAGRFGEALEAFTKAAEVRPDDANLCFGAGVAAFMLGRDDVAQSRFESALALNPDFLSASVWLAGLHYQAGRLAGANATYETALRRAPENRGLQQKIADWGKQQELLGRFHETTAEPFHAVFEVAADEPLARKATERLETAYWRIGKTLGVYPSKRITVVLYTREQFTDVTGLTAWSAAAYDGLIRLPLAEALEQTDELDRVLSHELVHAGATMLGGRPVPAWVSEGLATVLEPAGSHEAEAALTRADVRPSLSALPRGFVGLSRHDAEIAYATSARAVRRLIEQRGVDT